MSTTFLLMAQYGGRPIIPIEWVARDFFSHLSVEKLVRKINDGDVVLPLVRIEASVKAAKGDLTGWLWTGLIERISQDRRSRTCGEVRRRARSRWY